MSNFESQGTEAARAGGAKRRPGRPPSDEAPEGERRAHILRAADDLFWRRGYAAVSLGEIAAEVGVSKAALYHHFSSKDALFAAVMRETLLAIGGAIRRTADAPGEVAEKLRLLIEIALLRVPMEADMGSMMRDAEEHLPAELRREIAEAEGALWDAMEGLMRQGVERGELKGHEPRILAHAFWELLGGFVGRRAREAGLAGRPDVADAVADIFLTGASAAPRAGPTEPRAGPIPA